MLTPEFITLTEQQETEAPQPTRTWLIQDGRLIKSIDGEQATKQMVWKSLMTERFAFPIYSDNYGCEIISLIGKGHTQNYLDTAVPNMIADALSIDDRIDSVVSAEVIREDNNLHINATIKTKNGENEVNISV
jgi:hypothetical protein